MVDERGHRVPRTNRLGDAEIGEHVTRRLPGDGRQHRDEARERGPRDVGERRAESRARDRELHHEPHAAPSVPHDEPVLGPVADELEIDRRLDARRDHASAGAHARDAHRYARRHVHEEIAEELVLAVARVAGDLDRPELLLADHELEVFVHRSRTRRGA